MTIGTLAGQFKDDNFVEDKGIFGSNALRNWSLFTLINHVGCGGAVEKERSEDCLNERRKNERSNAIDETEYISVE